MHASLGRLLLSSARQSGWNDSEKDVDGAQLVDGQYPMSCTSRQAAPVQLGEIGDFAGKENHCLRGRYRTSIVHDGFEVRFTKPDHFLSSDAADLRDL